MSRRVLAVVLAASVIQTARPREATFSPDTIRWRRAAIVELRKLGIDL